jgi:hypothetical protein
MPWYGDQFDYAPAYVHAMIEGYPLLREAAYRDPCCGAAVICYDLGRAFENVRLTKRQAEAVELRAQGLTEDGIGMVLRVSQPAIHYRLYLAAKKICTFLNDDTYETAPPRANTY